MTRQRILITGASSGLGAGMARAFAAKGRDLALCARRTERLEELRTELAQRYPDVKVAIAALDVNDHDQVPKVFAELSDALGGIDRVIVNAGIGKGAKLGSGQIVGQQGDHRNQPGGCPGANRNRTGDVQGAGIRAPGADLLGARIEGRARCESGLRRKQSRPEFTGRIAARRIRQRPDQGVGDGTRLHRVGDDGQIAEHNVHGGQRNWRQVARRRDRARTGPCRRSVVAVGADGATAAA